MYIGSREVRTNKKFTIHPPHEIKHVLGYHSVGDEKHVRLAIDAALSSKWDEALKWVDQSIKVKETFRNLSAKANLLWAAGRKEEALAAADVAIAKGKADKVDTSSFEKRVANMKSGKM